MLTMNNVRSKILNIQKISNEMETFRKLGIYPYGHPGNKIKVKKAKPSVKRKLRSKL